VVHGVSYAEQKHNVTTLLQCTTTPEQACLITAVTARRQCVHPFPPKKASVAQKAFPNRLLPSRGKAAAAYPRGFGSAKGVCIWRNPGR